MSRCHGTDRSCEEEKRLRYHQGADQLFAGSSPHVANPPTGSFGGVVDPIPSRPPRCNQYGNRGWSH
jgi:hypothetical protein